MNKKLLFHENPTKKLFFFKYPKLDLNFCLVNIIIKVMAQSFQNTLAFNHNIINYGRNGFLKSANVTSLLPKKSLFSPFLDTKQFVAMKMANHHDKQFTPSDS